MNQYYSQTTWTVKAGSEDELVRCWTEFAEWSAREGLAAHARLLRDIDEPGRFVSFGPWETVEAIMRWRTLPGFQEHVARMTELLERFDSHTVELVTEH